MRPEADATGGHWPMCVSGLTLDVRSPSVEIAEVRLTVQAPSTGETALKESFLLLSDVHLGRDLASPTAPSVLPKASSAIDGDLVRLLEHYRKTPPTGDRWRLVLVGDFIDFIGITLHVAEGVAMETELSEEERLHGLGSASDHARIKLRRVAELHRPVFEALARFVAHGNALTVVHGNHDVELYWEEVQSDFRALLASFLDSDADRDAFQARIAFHQWFYYVDGVAYVEHGHQYDEFCATEHVMAPLSPLDPRRIAQGFCEVLIRFVVRPTRGLREWGHEHLGVFDYVAVAVGLGLRGCLDLGLRFLLAVVELFRLRRQYLSEAAKSLRSEHERRVALLAEATRIGIDRLHALAALQAPPVTRSIRGILASVLLDQIALGLFCSLCLVVIALIGMRHGHVWYGVGCIAVAWALAHRYLDRQRKVDPADVLIDRAGHLSRLFPAAFVVMGHTHVPVKVPVNDGASTYVNLGAWAEEAEAEAMGYRAPRTHLVIRMTEGRPVGELLKWDSIVGPTRYSGTIRPPPPASNEGKAAAASEETVG
jgi:UDP-2,3-diacylglucosamine pyrophosphatase LpxH